LELIHCTLGFMKLLWVRVLKMMWPLD